MYDGSGVYRDAIARSRTETDALRGGESGFVQAVPEPAHNAKEQSLAGSAEPHLQQHLPLNFFRARVIRVGGLRLGENLDRRECRGGGLPGRRLPCAFVDRRISKCSVRDGPEMPRCARAGCRSIGKSTRSAQRSRIADRHTRGRSGIERADPCCDRGRAARRSCRRTLRALKAGNFNNRFRRGFRRSRFGVSKSAGLDCSECHGRLRDFHERGLRNFNRRRRNRRLGRRV